MENTKIILIIMSIAIGLLVLTNCLTIGWLIESDKQIKEASVLLDKYSVLSGEIQLTAEECSDGWQDAIDGWTLCEDKLEDKK